MSDKYNVLINGASGVGLELIKILSNHKFINLKYVQEDLLENLLILF